MSSYPDLPPAPFATRATASSDLGFTLVEIMVAMTIFLAASVGVAQLLAMTTRMHIQAQNTTEATRLAESKLDELSSLDFATDPSIQITSADALNQNVANYFDTPDANVIRRWVVTAGPTATTRSVTVRVIGGVGSVGERAVDLTTVFRQW